MKYRIDVNILDDHTMVCEGLADAINRSDVAHVSRTFNTIESCRQAFRERRPDVLLLDISIPDGDGAAFCQEVIQSCPKVKVVAVTIHDEYSVIRRITDLGIHGYVLKSSTVDTLLEAIVSVWQGRRYISAEAETILRQGAAQAVSLTFPPASASQCVRCGKCEQHCPQSIPIREKLVEAEKDILSFPYGPAIGVLRFFMLPGKRARKK